jgi:hypothetical protein
MATVLCRSRDRSKDFPDDANRPCCSWGDWQDNSEYMEATRAYEIDDGRTPIPKPVRVAATDRTVESERRDAEIRQSEYTGANYSLCGAIPIFPFSFHWVWPTWPNNWWQPPGRAWSREAEEEPTAAATLALLQPRPYRLLSCRPVWTPTWSKTRPEVIVCLAVVRSGTPC